MSQAVRVFLLIKLVATAICLQGESSALGGVTIRIYSDVHIAPQTQGQAEQEAARIFHQAAIEITWIDCEAATTARDPRCHIAPDAKHLVIRIVAKASSAADFIFGMAFLSETDGYGVYSDVFFGSLEKLHQESGASLGRILGHVMAHEVGHLLLGSKAHTNIGIMQPHWYAEQLGAISRGSLFFTPEQATLMQKRLVST